MKRASQYIGASLRMEKGEKRLLPKFNPPVSSHEQSNAFRTDARRGSIDCPEQRTDALIAAGWRVAVFIVEWVESTHESPTVHYASRGGRGRGRAICQNRTPRCLHSSPEAQSTSSGK